MLRDNVFAPGETYHCFTRGVNRQIIFTDEIDYRRFVALLLVCNGHNNVHFSNLLAKYQDDTSRAYRYIFENEIPEERLVHIVAYSLMPNHIHLILAEHTEGGISKFTQRLFTAYSMYVNKKLERTGPLFEKPFKSRHVGNESYFRWIFSYVHLNPLALIAPAWEEKGIPDIAKARTFMRSYRWSSYYDYAVLERPEKSVLAPAEAPFFLTEHDDLQEMLEAYKNQDHD